MKWIHVIGRKNSGKTTMIENLIKELTGRGMKIGSVKHAGHSHDLDLPGKDSWRHGNAGASPWAFVTPDGIGLCLPREAGSDFYTTLEPHYSGCKLVFVEGDHSRKNLKLEVWHKGCESDPIAFETEGVAVIITNDPIESDIPVLPNDDISHIANFIVKLAQLD